MATLILKVKQFDIVQFTGGRIGLRPMGTISRTHIDIIGNVSCRVEPSKRLVKRTLSFGSPVSEDIEGARKALLVATRQTDRWLKGKFPGYKVINIPPA